MASQALTDWQVVRAARIQELLDAHQQVGGTGQGRRWRTTQLNWALTLRVAAEFQGFARNLHDLAASEIAGQTAQLNFPVGTTLQRILTNGRDLDRGNPGPGALGRDFGMLGMSFWPDLRQRYPTRATTAHTKLEMLLEARNGIAHDDQQKIKKVQDAGYPLTQLATVKSWNAWMGNLAKMMDATVGQHVGRVFGGASPW